MGELMSIRTIRRLTQVKPPTGRIRNRLIPLVAFGLMTGGLLHLTEVSADGTSPTIVGTACSKVGAKRTVRKVAHTCSLVGKRRVWTRTTKTAATPNKRRPPTPPTASPATADACKLSNPNGKAQGISLGFPRLAERLKSTGTVRIGVVFVDFPDSVATRTTQSVFSVISPDAERRYSAMSYGKATFELVPLQRWLRMGRASTAYSMSRTNTTFNSHRDFISEALNLSSGLLSVNDLDGFVVLANPDAASLDFGPAFTPNDTFFAATAAGREWMNGASSGTDLLNWGSGWFNHEFGHAMGLVDLYAFSGSGNRFVGQFSLMGQINGGAPELFGWERWSLGWVADSQVSCLTTGSSTTDLTPIATAGGIKIAVAKLSSSRAVVVESRRRLGYDTGLSKEGAIVYVVDTLVRSGEGVLRVLPLNDSDQTKMSVALGAGESLTFENVQVRVVSSGAGGDRITLRIG